jgi:hypothetical protein
MPCLTSPTFCTLALAALVPAGAWGCASCGCSLSADAATGYAATAGWRLGLQFDFINQDELRSGTRSASPQQVVEQPSIPALHGGEIEAQTINRYLTAGVTYSPNPDWYVDLRLPYVMRDHWTYGVQVQPYTPAATAPDQLSYAQAFGLGDARVVGNYQGFLPTRNIGVQLGFKLPTGAYGTSRPFNYGPLTGAPLDASLQPGTGSTDLILGAYYYTAISQNFDVIANGQFQSALWHRQNQPGQDFRPGNSVLGAIGLRYLASPSLVPQAQVNVVHKTADQGALADTADTAGTVVYLSPGLTVRVTRRVHVYAFVQVPVISNLSGYQLLPRWTASVGLSYAP